MGTSYLGLFPSIQIILYVAGGPVQYISQWTHHNVRVTHSITTCVLHIAPCVSLHVTWVRTWIYGNGTFSWVSRAEAGGPNSVRIRFRPAVMGTARLMELRGGSMLEAVLASVAGDIYCLSLLQVDLACLCWFLAFLARSGCGLSASLGNL